MGAIQISLIIIGSVFSVALTLTLLLYHAKHLRFVKTNSETIKNLRAINDRYKFHQFDHYYLKNMYDNECYFDMISCIDYLIYEIQFDSRDILRKISFAKQNFTLYEKYKKDVGRITSFGTFSANYKRLNLKRLVRIEKKLFESLLLTPITQLHAYVTLYLSTINGHIKKKKSALFNQNDLLQYLKRVSNKNGRFFNDRGIWEAICRVERGRVSNRMRFSIYKRDYYRCRRCGRSERFVKLEIDHIIPISKGGKSTYDNLQTLCHSCNVRKGDSMPYR